MTEPKYDEDVVNLGYLKRALGLSDEEAKELYKYISRHYGSKPQPPYYVGDTWVDGTTIYTCINERLIGTYQESDWTSESGAKQEAEKKNRVFLTQPSNYKPGDMWILQTDIDHRSGKKGEILISTAGRAVYDSDDWVNMLGYGTIRSINEVANNLKEALTRLDINKESGVLTIYYSNSIPETPVQNDLWYVTETVDLYEKGKVYVYNENWQEVDDNLTIVAFEEANEARLVEDGRIQSYYSSEEPTEGMGAGDIWTNTETNKLYRYNGTNWIAVYATNLSEITRNVSSITERATKLETDLGNITGRVSKVETTINDDLITKEELSTTVETTEGKFNVEIAKTNTSITKLEDKVIENEEKQSQYLRYYLDANNNNKGTLELGESDSPLKVKLTNEEMAFTENDNKVAYINGNKLYITTAEILTALIIGNFGFTPLSNGSVTFGKVK